VDKKLLNRYFEKRCSATEMKAVEEWILNPENRSQFEHFLVSQWDNHVDQHLDVPVVARRKSVPVKWWASAAAAIAIVSGVYFYSTPPLKTKPLAVVISLPQVEQVGRKAYFPRDTFQTSIKPKTITHHERKTVRNKSIQIVAETDTISQGKKPLFVKSTKLENFMVNKVALHKLFNDIDSNKAVLLNLNVHDITFERLAVLLREECGIVLVPCNGNGTSKTYTARFEEISLPDLLNDMSEKMMFSYSVKDNKVKICFN